MTGSLLLNSKKKKKKKSLGALNGILQDIFKIWKSLAIHVHNSVFISITFDSKAYCFIAFLSV